MVDSGCSFGVTEWHNALIVYNMEFHYKFIEAMHT